MDTLAEPAVYAWPPSVVGGEVVGIHAAGPPAPAQLTIARVGGRREVVHRESFALQPHPVPDTAAASGCDWPVALGVTVDDAWPSGYYEVVVRTDAARVAHEAVGCFVVRAARPDPDRPLIALCTNTYHAYNDFGGHNLYDGGTHVSFARPLAKGLLRKPDGPGARVTVMDTPDPQNRVHVRYLREHAFTQWAGSAGWPNYEHGFVRWCERHGYPLDYAVNADLEDPATLEGRRLYLSVGHDEYWSAPMRDTVESFTRAGGNAAFLSGNTAFWQVRIEDDGRTMVGYKDRFRHDPVYGTDRQTELTSMWSDPLIGRPENHLTGVSFVRGGYHRIGRTVASGAGGYTVYDPDHWVFEGTGTTWGDLVGAESVIVGYECDGCDFVMRDGRPVPTGTDGTPADFRILGIAPTQHFDRHNAPRPPGANEPSEVEGIAMRMFGSAEPEHVARVAHGHATMGIHEPGGFVFTAATTDWAWGLTGADPVVEQLTRNLLDRGLGRT